CTKEDLCSLLGRTERDAPTQPSEIEDTPIGLGRDECLRFFRRYLPITETVREAQGDGSEAMAPQVGRAQDEPFGHRAHRLEERHPLLRAAGVAFAVRTYEEKRLVDRHGAGMLAATGDHRPIDVRHRLITRKLEAQHETLARDGP